VSKPIANPWRARVWLRRFSRFLRDLSSLHLEQIHAFLPLSRWWFEHRLGISEPKELMLIEADQDLPPEIRKMDLLLVDRAL